MVCLQKYVKSNGNCAFICRTVYKPKGCSSCSIITNKTSYYEETESEVRRFLVVPSRSHNVSTCQGKHLSETKMYLKEIVEYFKFQRGISLSEIIGDFIKD